MRALRYALPLALFGLLSGVLAVGLRLDPHEVPSPLIGKVAPAFALGQLDPQAATLTRDQLHGQVWMLNVWASWCDACRDEQPMLVEFAQRHRVPVFGLDYKDTRAEAGAWLQRHGNPYRATMFDGDGKVGIDFGVYGVPETFLIDRHGVVRLKIVGPLTPEVVARRIEPMLKELDG